MFIKSKTKNLYNICTKQNKFCSIERQAPSSIEFLEDKGVDLSYYREYGIPRDKFRSPLFSNDGLMGNPDFKWLTFQGFV